MTLTASSVALGDTSCTVEVEPAVAVAVHAVLDPPFLPADGESTGRLLATMSDRFGNATRAATVSMVEDKDAPSTLAYDAATRAFVGPLRSRKGVEQRALTVTGMVLAPLTAHPTVSSLRSAMLLKRW